MGQIDIVNGDEIQIGQGNFRKFRIVAGDTKLLEHLSTCGKNATYISPTIHNEIIDACNTIFQY